MYCHEAEIQSQQCIPTIGRVFFSNVSRLCALEDRKTLLKSVLPIRPIMKTMDVSNDTYFVMMLMCGILTVKRLEHSILHTSLKLTLAHVPDASNEVHDSLHAEPDGFDAKLAVSFAREEAAQPHLACIRSGRSLSGSGCGANGSDCLTVVNTKCGLACLAHYHKLDVYTVLQTYACRTLTSDYL